MLSILLILTMLPCPASAGQAAGEQGAGESGGSASGERVVLTICDMNTRSGNRYSEERGLWRYLADRLGVEIQYDYIPKNKKEKSREI